jgi:hypothetical protein
MYAYGEGAVGGRKAYFSSRRASTDAVDDPFPERYGGSDLDGGSPTSLSRLRRTAAIRGSHSRGTTGETSIDRGWSDAESAAALLCHGRAVDGRGRIAGRSAATARATSPS